MELKNRIQALSVVGASVTASCQPCLRSTVAMALESGANEREIAEAILVGKKIRRGAASKMDKFASERNLADSSPVSVVDSGCECGRL